MRRPRRHPSRSGGGSGAGSTSPKMPSRAHTKPTRPRRNRWKSVEITERAGSQPPAGMHRNHSAGQHAEADAAEPRRRDHFRKRLRPWEAPDRFDQISIGFRVTRDRAAERRNDVEGIEIVERIEPGHIDSGKFEAEKPAAMPQHAIEFGERDVDPRHVADAERDGTSIEAAAREGQAFGVACREPHAGVKPALRRAFTPDVEHFSVDVANHAPGTGAC